MKALSALRQVFSLKKNEELGRKFSPSTLSEIRRGEDMCIYQYVRVIRCMMKYLHLIVRMDMLLKELRAVLASNCDLVVATIPHRFHGTYQPKEWVVVMHWDGIR